MVLSVGLVVLYPGLSSARELIASGLLVYEVQYSTAVGLEGTSLPRGSLKRMDH